MNSHFKNFNTSNTSFTLGEPHKGGFRVIAETTRNHIFSKEISQVMLAAMVLAPDFYCKNCQRLISAMRGNPPLAETYTFHPVFQAWFHVSQKNMCRAKIHKCQNPGREFQIFREFQVITMVFLDCFTCINEKSGICIAHLPWIMGNLFDILESICMRLWQTWLIFSFRLAWEKEMACFELCFTCTDAKLRHLEFSQLHGFNGFE